MKIRHTNKLSCALQGALLLALLPACGLATSMARPVEKTGLQSAAEFNQRISQVLTMPHRSEQHRARDRYRHPIETLEFFGLADTQTVIEITPGGGWYAEILAPLLKEKGHYVAAIADLSKVKSQFEKAEYTQENNMLAANFKATPAAFNAAELLNFDPKAPEFGADNSADLVVTFRNAHNWVTRGDAVATFKAIFRTLKPGGRLGLVDHRATPGLDFVNYADTGYVAQAAVIEFAKQAGFVLLAQSEINANPRDTKNHPDGVWSLPPTYAGGDTDRAIYAAIGESDRMTLVFRKP
jgi:predicted methyltransferase